MDSGKDHPEEPPGTDLSGTKEPARTVPAGTPDGTVPKFMPCAKRNTNKQPTDNQLQHAIHQIHQYIHN